MFDSRPENPVLGRKFQIESEFQVQNAEILLPEAKVVENRFEICFKIGLCGV